MKTLIRFSVIGITLIGLTVLQSCSDDDADNSPPSITYPHTVAFTQLEIAEFKMWTNGAEVNTEDLDFLDFVEDSEDSLYLSPGYYESSSALTFTEDSVFGLSVDSTLQGYPYIISNDSVYTKIDGFFGSDTIVNVFFGLGSPSHLIIPQGFAQFSNLYIDQNVTINHSYAKIEFQTFESASEHWDIFSLDNIEEGDTLIINNRYIHFQ